MTYVKNVIEETYGQGIGAKTTRESNETCISGRLMCHVSAKSRASSFCLWQLFQLQSITQTTMHAWRNHTMVQDF